MLTDLPVASADLQLTTTIVREELTSPRRGFPLGIRYRARAVSTGLAHFVFAVVTLLYDALVWLSHETKVRLVPAVNLKLRLARLAPPARCP